MLAPTHTFWSMTFVSANSSDCCFVETCQAKRAQMKIISENTYLVQNITHKSSKIWPLSFSCNKDWSNSTPVGGERFAWKHFRFEQSFFHSYRFSVYRGKFAVGQDDEPCVFLNLNTTLKPSCSRILNAKLLTSSEKFSWSDTNYKHEPKGKIVEAKQLTQEGQHISPLPSDLCWKNKLFGKPNERIVPKHFLKAF